MRHRVIGRKLGAKHQQATQGWGNGNPVCYGNALLWEDKQIFPLRMAGLTVRSGQPRQLFGVGMAVDDTSLFLDRAMMGH